MRIRSCWKSSARIEGIGGHREQTERTNKQGKYDQLGKVTMTTKGGKDLKWNILHLSTHIGRMR